MFAAGDYLMYFVGIASAICAPLSAQTLTSYNDKLIAKGTSEFMEKQANEMGDQVGRLQKTAEDLSDTATRIQELEATLKMITETQGQNITKLEDQVRQTENLLKEKKKNWKSLVLRSLLHIIIENDKDGDFTVDPDELDPMCKGLNDLANVMDGITFFEDNFRHAVITTGGSIKDMMALIKNIDPESDHPPIFVFEPPKEDEAEDNEDEEEEEAEAEAEGGETKSDS